MNNQWNRSLLDLSALLVTGALLATSVASTAMAAEEGVKRVGMSEAWEIPTQLSNEPREDEPDGTCSRCVVDDIGINGADDGDTTAQLTLYFEDNGEDTTAEIHVRLLLVDGSYEALTVSDVVLVDGEFHVVELGQQPGWAWDDVSYAWVDVG